MDMIKISMIVNSMVFVVFNVFCIGIAMPYLISADSTELVLTGFLVGAILILIDFLVLKSFYKMIKEITDK